MSRVSVRSVGTAHQQHTLQRQEQHHGGICCSNEPKLMTFLQKLHLSCSLVEQNRADQRANHLFFQKLPPQILPVGQAIVNFTKFVGGLKKRRKSQGVRVSESCNVLVAV
ncbi:unnamed protein product [Fraxinus pennsylvanica]|uniref:Uncharacterized protein n=1 Tax=Fraxinus pennsylvanica TaxID=56036 RepID=A0AAD2EE31_9LAMI|nr:unnamed protein product [Fraxinus pennsylvanica]